MYDKIRGRTPIKKGEQDRHRSKNFVEKRTVIDAATKAERIEGEDKNFRVCINENHIYLTGSYTTYAQGNNNTNSDLRSFTRQFIGLGKDYSIDSLASIITQIEFGYIVQVDHPPHFYLEEIIGLQGCEVHKHYSKSGLLGSVTLVNTLYSLIFYNKPATP